MFIESVRHSGDRRAELTDRNYYLKEHKFCNNFLPDSVKVEVTIDKQVRFAYIALMEKNQIAECWLPLTP